MTRLLPPLGTGATSLGAGIALAAAGIDSAVMLHADRYEFTVGAVLAAILACLIAAGVITWIRTDAEFVHLGHRLEDARFSIGALVRERTARDHDIAWLRAQLEGMGLTVTLPSSGRHVDPEPAEPVVEHQGDVR